MKFSVVVVSALLLATVACRPESAPVAQVAAASPPNSPPNPSTAELPRTSPSPGADAVVGVTPGMPYAAFRKAAMDQGWQPKADADCLTNVVGSNFKDVCQADASRCRACTDMPELSAYSGDGQMLARFQHASDHRVLEVGASGVLESWNQSGHEADLQVASWNVAPAAR